MVEIIVRRSISSNIQLDYIVFSIKKDTHVTLGGAYAGTIESHIK